jgi:alpha-L-fucosidase
MIHWGPFSLLGKGEWVRQGDWVNTLKGDRMSVGEYERCARDFNPNRYNPNQWMKIASKAGMKYAVIVTKHIDGYCLFDSGVTDYTSVHSAARKDFIRDFVDAARKCGLRVGLYYSLIDWHHPDALAGSQDEEARRRYVGYVHSQVEELCSNYGTIDLLYYDMPWTYSAQEWESERLNARVRDLQPEILINDRSKVPGDFSTPEQYILPAPRGRSWEAALTFNDNWPWVPADTNWKSVAQIISLLARCASGGGNLLLNVGPKPEGVFPQVCASRLKKVGAWLDRNGECIYGSERFDHGGFEFGPVTAKGNELFLIVGKNPEGDLRIDGLSNAILSARVLGDKKKLRVKKSREGMTISGVPPRADDLPVVIVLELDGPPQKLPEKNRE